MTTYTPSKVNAKEFNKKLKEYRSVERQIEDAIREKRRELARIEAAKERLKTVATYEPTREAINYRDTHWAVIALQPLPKYGGPSGLRAAAAEIEAHDQRKRAAA